jgi:hypothetical protein
VRAWQHCNYPVLHLQACRTYSQLLTCTILLLQGVRARTQAGAHGSKAVLEQPAAGFSQAG